MWLLTLHLKCLVAQAHDCDYFSPSYTTCCDLFWCVGCDLDLFIAFHSPLLREATLLIALTAPEASKQLTHSVCCCPDHARHA